jgi:Cof subfamily protein (haloacid dehalogenase superfamily)
MKYDGIAIISDLDGTLLDEERNLSTENLEAIKEFIQYGGSFGVATGRMERTTRIKFPQLPVNVPSIFYNGALIYDLNLGTPLKKSVMPQGLDAFFQEYLDRYPDLGLEINANGTAYVIRSNAIIETQLEREGLEGVKASWQEVPQDWYKVLLAAERERLEVIKEELLNAGREDIAIVFSEKQLVDIMAKGVSKGNALQELRALTGRSWRMVIAIGDNENDLSMLQSADYGIAVGNACRAVKECADLVIKSNAYPAIPEVLEYLGTKGL